MEFLKFKLEKLSEKYKLNFRNFRFENKKIFFKQKTTIYYGVNNFFFPFFISKNEDDLENWLESISVTYKNKVKLLSTIDEGKDKRNKFKRKYKI